jgi:hypothetical protein
VTEKGTDSNFRTKKITPKVILFLTMQRTRLITATAIVKLRLRWSNGSLDEPESRTRTWPQ